METLLTIYMARCTSSKPL